MFDRIGSADDPEARRRQAASLGITLTLGTGGLAFWTAFTWWAFVAPPPPVPEPLPPVLIELAAADEPALPAAPAAPAAAPAQKGEEPAPAPTEPTEPTELSKEPPPDEVKGPAGTPTGTPDGALDGTGPKGPPGGGTGDGEGPGGGGSFTVHHTALEWKIRPAPTWPSGATSMGIDEAVCTASVEFDQRGVPQEVTFPDCPGVFQNGARSAILRSRVEPFETSTGLRVSVRTTLRIRYLRKE